jgi:hypothetical protein
MQGKKECSYAACGIVTFMENSMKSPQKTENRTAIQSSNTTPRDIPGRM